MYSVNNPAYMAAQRPDGRAAQLAHDTIRSLLNGAAPAALSPASPHHYGRWTATMEQLFAAYNHGGTRAVEQVYQELHRGDDQLIGFLCSIAVRCVADEVDEAAPCGPPEPGTWPRLVKAVAYDPHGNLVISGVDDNDAPRRKPSPPAAPRRG